MDSREDRNRFSLIARVKSLTHALRGLGIIIKTTPNFWWHMFFALLAVFLGFLLSISDTEWMMIVLSVGLVLVAESFNTAIEIDINLTSPEYHPYARDTKDVAAGSVLLSAIIAVIVGLIIFLPKVLLYVNI
jgi:diacylglycerol kinase (ATP)